MKTIESISDRLVRPIGHYDPKKYHIFVVIKPGSLNHTDDVISMMTDEGWRVAHVKTKRLTYQEAKELYKVHKKEDFYESLCRYMSSGMSTGMILVKDQPISPDMFRETDRIKNKVRKKYSESDMRNVMHSSDSMESMAREQTIYFNTL